MTQYGYARVSTLEQSPALQLDALRAEGIVDEHLFVDHASGTKTSRPSLDAVLEVVRVGDVLTVWKLDRLGRSTTHLIRTIEDLGARGVQFRSLRDPIDTTTPSGRLVLGIMASLSQFERELLVERTAAGLAAARARGARVGRRPSVTGAQLVWMERLVDEGVPHAKIAELTGLSKAAVGRALRGEIAGLAQHRPGLITTDPADPGRPA